MSTKAGVWIDHKHAIVILLTDAGLEIKKIAFALGQPVQTKGKAPSKNKYTRNDYVPEDRLERKAASDRKDYYDDVIAGVQGAEALLILGPAGAKTELSKRITAQKLRGMAVALETADKMTDRQLIAKVQQSFAASPAKKSSIAKATAQPPKKLVKRLGKTTAQAAPAKPAKKKSRK